MTKQKNAFPLRTFFFSQSLKRAYEYVDYVKMCVFQGISEK